MEHLIIMDIENQTVVIEDLTQKYETAEIIENHITENMGLSLDQTHWMVCDNLKIKFMD